MRAFSAFAMLGLTALALAGCTTVAGVVVDQRGKPHTTAAFSIGRPDGLGAYALHRVDKEGRFKFSILGSDENYLWVYDADTDPMATARRIDRSEISDHMRIILPQMQKGQDAAFSRDHQLLNNSMKEGGVNDR